MRKMPKQPIFASEEQRRFLTELGDEELAELIKEYISEGDRNLAVACAERQYRQQWRCYLEAVRLGITAREHDGSPYPSA